MKRSKHTAVTGNVIKSDITITSSNCQHQVICHRLSLDLFLYTLWYRFWFTHAVICLTSDMQHFDGGDGDKRESRQTRWYARARWTAFELWRWVIRGMATDL